MRDYRWTLRVGLGYLGVIGLWVVFVVVVRAAGRPLAGVEPEAWAVVVMMTAPLVIGTWVLAVIVTALAEAGLRRVARRRLEEEADVQV